MGQVLSVLVACVGTVELIDFYRNVTRNFQAPVVSRREQLRKKYLDNLEKRRDEILEEIQRRKQHEEGSQIIDSEKDFSIGTTNCSKPSSVEVRKYFDTNTCFANCETAQHCTGTLCRTAIQNEDKTNVCGINNTTTQDICPNDIICTKPVVGRTSIEEICSTNGSRLSNNKAFKQNTLQKVDNENTSSQVIFKPVAKENFFDSHFTGESFNYSRRAVTEPNMETNFENSRGHGNDVAITNIKNCNSLENSSYSSLSNDSDSTSQLHLIQGESSKSRSRSRSPNPLPNNSVSKRPKSTSQSPNTSPFLSSDETYFREPLSPNQIFVSAPRNSICNYVWDNPTSAVLQVDEDSFVFKCTTPKILLSSNHSFSEYWSNKKWLHSTIICNKKHVRCTSPCPRKIASLGFRCRSKSESDCKDLCSRFHGVSKNKEHFHEQFLNTLDGVTKEGKKRKQKYHLKRNKTKEPKADPTDAAMQGDTGSTKFLDQAVNVLNNNLSGLEDERTTHKSEPFWLIFSGEYTKAMNKDWHGQHFCCWQCDESLTGQRYVLRDDHPYCVSCYESVFANACEKCSKIIGIDSKDLSYKDKHWHEVCFLCTTCGESLVDKQFGSKGDRIYCGRCYDEQFASRCDGCHEIFRAGTKKMEYKTRQWHEKCFCCCVCKVPIGTQSFIPREQEIYCAKCYEEKFATRCIKCNKVITSGGVTYKNEPWHRECFTCTHCTKSLAGERFTSRDEKPYCAECFGELFAKRCFACNKPITGIGGTKFISFEDRHWHNDCFFCASCRTSLVGRGFITDQDDIICPECAKQKLM